MPLPPPDSPGPRRLPTQTPEIPEYWRELPVKVPWRSTRVAAAGDSLDGLSPMTRRESGSHSRGMHGCSLAYHFGTSPTFRSIFQTESGGLESSTPQVKKDLSHPKTARPPARVLYLSWNRVVSLEAISEVINHRITEDCHSWFQRRKERSHPRRRRTIVVAVVEALGRCRGMPLSGLPLSTRREKVRFRAPSDRPIPLGNVSRSFDYF